jgi:hypothetical protein
MSDTIYEAILKGKSRQEIATEFNIDLKQINEMADGKFDYDALSPHEKDKALHTLSLLTKQSWKLFDMSPIENKTKLLELMRKLQHDRSEIQGLTKDTVQIDGEITINWGAPTP